MGLAYSRDIFSYVKNFEARDWYATVWEDILNEVVWCAYEFDAPVKCNYLLYMEGMFEDLMEHHREIEIEKQL